ncbi:MAG: quinone-dependent dihydroorotate dehydrogenase [Candidatus Dactylopiibacterium sp.]|nr:quinone-dependent dihydroorotate dehydrogenase [Candidatus Dactylopiibacterium sp.]
MLYSLARPVLFSLDPECAHELSIRALSHLGGWLPLRAGASGETVEVMGLRFPNRVGLAAGLDKNGEAIDALARFGFGHIEVGTVTPRAQPGNPRPRMFRLPAQRAIINRMGFNNLGADNLVSQLKASRFKGIVGVSIGKNFDTPLEQATDDYLACLDTVYGHASYVAANISSPNTRNLRQLQGESELDLLLSRLAQRREALAQQHGRYVPIAIKIAPDVEDDQLAVICDALRRHRMDGVIATNTTLARDAVQGLRHAEEAGGLSGAPLRERATDIVRALARRLGGELPIIGVGGIMNAGDAHERLLAGAALVQVYTGFIYGGPAFVTDCIDATRHFERDAPETIV